MNPVLREVGATIAKLAGAASRRAVNRLHELLGALTEDQFVCARTATVFLRIGDGRLRAVATANLQRTTLEISEEDCGVVPLVAREGRPRFVPDVDDDDDYFPDIDETRSELAVPLLLNNGVVIGVVNLESDRLNHFGPEALAAVKKLAGELTVELLVLWEEATGGATRLPWHPGIHGWDLQEIMTDLCHCISRSLNRDCVKAAIPFVDLENVQAHFYATSGAGYILRTRPLPKFLTSDLRNALRFKVGEVVEYNPSRDLAKAHVTIDVEEGWLIKVHSVKESREKSHGLAALAVFVASGSDESALEKESRRINIREALPELGKMLQDWFDAFAALRPLMATACLNSRIHPLHTCRGKFDSLLHSAMKTLPASAGTVFAVPKESSQLLCVATTGLVNLQADDGSDAELSYDLLTDIGQWTVDVAYKNGNPIRINHVRGRCKSVRSRPYRNRGAKLREILPGDDDDNRRLLSVGIVENGEILGVMRVVRTLEEKPFTLCDGRLMQDIAKVGAEIIKAWRDILEQPKTKVKKGCDEYGRRLVGAVHSED